MRDFSYSDKGDKLTQQLIESEYDPAYWGRSEDLVLDRAIAFLRARLGQRLKTARLLDLGCGMGRLIPLFAPLVGHVVALEPDKERCAAAAELVEREHITNAEVHNLYSSEFLARNPGAHFDAVLCSHIFQHFTHATLHGILSDLTACTDEKSVFARYFVRSDGVHR